jgi:CRISPR-associated protein Csm2
MPSKDLVGLAENMARRFVEHDIKTHQVRKILSALRSLESDLAGKTDLPPAKFLAEELPFLKARMAYAGTRSRIGEDQRHLDACIDAVQGPADFEKLIKFAEALVAYHKYHGGKETGR